MSCARGAAASVHHVVHLRRFVTSHLQALDQNTGGHVKLVSSLLGEVMLCTKEANTRARTAAFDLLVAMGHWMFAGGEGPGLAPGAVVTQTDPTLTLFFRGVRARAFDHRGPW